MTNFARIFLATKRTIIKAKNTISQFYNLGIFPMQYLISTKKQPINGTITLDGSKSISNRALIIRALCDSNFDIAQLSTSDDTKAMLGALTQQKTTIDVGAAGTTMRFLTAYFALQKGEWLLTGSERMKQRPIGVLVEALQQLGASIEYVESSGCPPLKIIGKALEGRKVSMSAGVSSQYLSALLMIAPVLKNGLQLALIGDLVSKPYLMMTLRLMEYFGVQHEWLGNRIAIAPQHYNSKNFVVESDWSAASYPYALVALSESADLYLNGLQPNSLQGDSVLPEIMAHFGVKTSFTDKGIHLSKQGDVCTHFDYDFIACPDLAQTIAVVCAGLQVSARFTGLQTLSIKETDRTAALRIELAKFGVDFYQKGDAWILKPKAGKTATLPIVKTYHDHRMAMAFAPLALRYGELIIDNPMVVTKSYPNYWEDMASLGQVYQTVPTL